MVIRLLTTMFNMVCDMVSLISGVLFGPVPHWVDSAPTSSSLLLATALVGHGFRLDVLLHSRTELLVTVIRLRVVSALIFLTMVFYTAFVRQVSRHGGSSRGRFPHGVAGHGHQTPHGYAQHGLRHGLFH